MCIFDSDLSLTYTTKAMQGVWHNRSHLVGKPIMKPLQ